MKSGWVCGCVCSADKVMPSGTVDSSHRYNSKQFPQPSVWGLKLREWSVCGDHSWQRDNSHNIHMKAASFSSSAVLHPNRPVNEAPRCFSVCLSGSASSSHFKLIIVFYISTMICSLKRIKSGYSSRIKGSHSVKVISMFPCSENKLRIL